MEIQQTSDDKSKKYQGMLTINQKQPSVRMSPDADPDTDKDVEIRAEDRN
jgi:hypothetical protein